MSYLSFIESQKEAIKGFEQEGFPWRNNGYDKAFLDMVSIVNPAFGTIIKSLPDTLNRKAVWNIFHLEKDLYKGFVASMLWGGINATRCAKGHKGDRMTTDAYKAFTYPKKEVVEKLSNVRTSLNKKDTEEAFTSMVSIKKNHIPGIGISFFTKLLYFMSPDAITPRLLIYDKWSTYIHCALLIDDSKRKVHDYYKKVNSDGTIALARTPVDLYMDYIDVMTKTAQANDIMDVSRLEAFLFGFALNGQGHKEEKERRAFLKKYVLDYFSKNKGNTANPSKNNKSKKSPKTTVELTDRVYELSSDEIIPERDNSNLLKKYRIVHQGNVSYLYLGKDKQKVFCEVFSPKGAYFKTDEIEANGFSRRGGKKPYYIKSLKRDRQDEGFALLRQMLKLLS